MQPTHFFNALSFEIRQLLALYIYVYNIFMDICKCRYMHKRAVTACAIVLITPNHRLYLYM